MQRNRNHLYTLRHDNGGFITGTTSDGRQVLMSGALGLFFDREGNFIDYEDRNPPRAGPTPGNPMGRPRPQYLLAVSELAQEWRQEMGFEARPIRVRRFSVPELDVEVLDDSGFGHPIADRAEWEREGNFVLCWGTEYWMSGDGNVLST